MKTPIWEVSPFSGHLNVNSCLIQDFRQNVICGVLFDCPSEGPFTHEIYYAIAIAITIKFKNGLCT